MEFDAKVPNTARMWNYWLGGKDNFAADRVAAERVTDALPTMPMVARWARRVLVDVVPQLVTVHGASDIEPAAAAELSERYNAMSPTKIRLRSRAEIAPFFDGLEMTGPGLVPLSKWWDAGASDTDTARGLVGHVGIARKP